MELMFSSLYIFCNVSLSFHIGMAEARPLAGSPSLSPWDALAFDGLWWPVWDALAFNGPWSPTWDALVFDGPWSPVWDVLGLELL